MSRYHKRKSRLSLYGIISSVSYLVRAISLPNPFAPIINAYLSQSGEQVTGDGLAFMFNFFIGSGIMFISSYLIVHAVYVKGSNPPLGSALYLLIFWINTFILIWLGNFGKLFALNVIFLITIIAFIMANIIEAYILKLIFNQIH